MTDESTSPPLDRVALQKAARDAVIEALQDWEAKSYNRGFYEGWEACNKHWRQMLADAAKQIQVTPHLAPEGADFSVNDQAAVGAEQAGQSKASDIVLGIIKDRPGLRGVEIVSAAGASGQPIHERTVRTALHRLKRSRLIENLEGRWFAIEAGPDHSAKNTEGANDAQK